MRWERKDGVTRIYLDADEDEMRAVVAIAQASYNLARPFMHSWRDYNPKKWRLTIPEGEVKENHICWRRKDEEIILVLELDEVDGRKCATFLYREAEFCFVLDTRFEECRGLPDEMLRNARSLLEGGLLEWTPSTESAYQGESLTLRLTALRFPRRERHGVFEDDWTYRRRVFPDLYETSRTLAWEFLLGRAFWEWDLYDKQYCYHLAYTYFPKEGRDITHMKKVVAAALYADPVEMRRMRARNYEDTA